MKKLLSWILLTALLCSLVVCSASAAVIEDEDGNVNFANAQAITLGDELHGEISSLLDCDVFVFTVGQTGTLEMNFTHESLRNDNYARWIVQVYDANLRALQTRYYYNATGAAYPTLLLTPGRYYLLINNGRTLTCGVAGLDYVLTTSFTVPGEQENLEKEPNGDAKHATGLELDDPCTGAISGNADKDWYGFTLEEKSNATILFEHEPLTEEEKWSIVITDETGKVLYEGIVDGTEPKTEIRLDALGEGEYFITVGNGDDGACNVSGIPYTLTVSAEKWEPVDLFCDVNMDGYVDAFDYMLVKAYVLGTDGIDPAYIARMNVNSDKMIDAFDYMLIKSVVLGTYDPA